LFEKFGQHQPLNRQADRYAREGVSLSLSTLADQVGAGCAALDPILKRIEGHVFAAERLHGDDTKARRRCRSRPLRSRWCGASILCSRSSDRSMARATMNG